MKRVQGALRNRGLLYFYMSTSKVFFNYADAHDVDEDIKSISVHGGHYRENKTGIARRTMNDTPTVAPSTIVASYVCEHHLLHLDGYHNVGYKIPTDQSIHMYPYLYKFS